MKAVFIGTELNEKYPEAFGSFVSEEPGAQWVTLDDVVAALQRGECVEIRPATDDEMANAEANAVLFDIGRQLGQAYMSLLERRGEDEAAKTVLNMLALVHTFEMEKNAASEEGGNAETTPAIEEEQA